MALSAAVIDAMVAAGCTAEQLAAAMKADISEQEQRARDKRAKDAERQRKSRRSRGLSRDVTVTECDIVDPSLPLSPQTPQTPTHPCNNNTRTRKEPPPAKPDGVSDQVWRDFLRHRAKRKADVSPTAIAGIRREADKAGWTLEAALAEVVSRGWQGFKSDWVTEARPPPGNGGSSLVQSILAR